MGAGMTTGAGCVAGLTGKTVGGDTLIGAGAGATGFGAAGGAAAGATRSLSRGKGWSRGRA